MFDDLAESAVPEGMWPQGPSGRLIVTSTRSAAIAYAAQRGAQVVPVGFFSRRESVNYLTERLSANPAQRHGAMELADELRCEPLALAQAASVVANSTLACRDYRDYFARRRQQMGADPDELPPALQAAIKLSAPARVQEPAARAAASALLETWPAEEPQPWAAERLRASAASLHGAAADMLWSGGCHPLLLRAGRSLDDPGLTGPAVEYWRELAARRTLEN